MGCATTSRKYIELKCAKKRATTSSKSIAKTTDEGIMKTRTIARSLAAIGLSVSMLTGCATTTETTDEMPDYAASPETGSEFSQGETPVTDVVSEASATLGTAYFDLDRSDVRGDMRGVLKANAEIIARSKSTTLIEGHADERGSTEYNHALGLRRAESVRKYLMALGVSDSQLEIRSYGEIRPAATGHDEASWSLNRRAEFHTR
jgi:peptidoglycan-associated lipoprotein